MVEPGGIADTSKKNKPRRDSVKPSVPALTVVFDPALVSGAQALMKVSTLAEMFVVAASPGLLDRVMVRAIQPRLKMDVVFMVALLIG